MVKKRQFAFILLVIPVLMLWLVACGQKQSASSSTNVATQSTTHSTLGTPGTYNCVSGSITAAGSTALAPFIQAVATQYQARCPKASIKVNLGGNTAGLTQVAAGSIQIGLSDTLPNADLQAGLLDHPIAVTPYALLLNKDVTGVDNLTLDQLKDIYSGTTTNWSQIGGPDKPIVVISRPASSVVRDTFQRYVLGTTENVTGPANLTSDNTSTVIKNLQQTSGAIGYAPVNAATNTDLTIVKIDGQGPTAELVKDNTYRFWSIEHLFTKGKPDDLSQAFIDYTQSPDGKAAATKLDLIAIRDMQPAALQTRQPGQ